jgi:DNA replication protein DnaC
MEQSPEGAKLRTEHCELHGQFESRHVMGRLWTRCQACADVAAAEREQEERVKAQLAAERRHLRMLDEARIPERFRGRTFSNFIADTDDKRHALTVCRDYAERFSEHGERGAGLIMAGRPGTGKSHMAGAILQHVLSPEVRYVTCSDLVRAVRETWRRESERTEAQLLRYLEGLDLLVIDELGARTETDNVQSIVFDVIDLRYREVKPTILLTNQDKVGLKQFVGDRTFDRLVETCRWIPFDWDSYRPTARKLAMSDRSEA